jgi:hypothetical protein
MKNIYKHSAILILLTFSLTLSAQKSVYSFPFENNDRLRPMSVIINQDEIASTYQTLGNLYTTEISGMGEQALEQTSTTMISDVTAVDAVRFLEFYTKDQLVAPGDEAGRTVEMSVIYYNSRSRANLGTLFTVLTLGLGALLGIPHSTGITDVEVQAIFYDDKNQILTTQRGLGRSKVLETLYNMNYSRRTQHQKAMRKALDDLNGKIFSDPALELLKQ